MKPTRRTFVTALAVGGVAMAQAASGGVTLYVRYEDAGNVHHGILEGDTIRQIEGDLLGERQPSGTTVKASDVKLLYPIQPSKVIALAGNYRSHIGGAEPPEHPEPFYKPITSLQHPGDPIVFPPGAQEVHYEAEFVIVIGKKAQRVSVEEAGDYILGYTCGNDVSEREWQNGMLTGRENKDMQWWRGKGSDTFGPMGPAIAVGLDYEKSTIQSRLNGEVRQKQGLRDLIHKPAEVVSFISQYVTLLPGDVIFTGTPGKTKGMEPGDIVEVEIDGIGVLSNPVVGSS